MTHEFKNIIEAYQLARHVGLKAVLATVVSVDGSSYRGAGVRMLVLQNQQIVGAISGGCVEKEVVQQSLSVFATGLPKMMTYDGRFRLGCEGTLYVLLEEFSIEENETIQIVSALNDREEFFINSYYSLDEKKTQKGSFLQLKEGLIIPFSKNRLQKENEINYKIFSEKMMPNFRLIIIGTEHDAVSLCKQASNLGWEILIMASPDSKKEKEQFVGASELLKLSPENFMIPRIDNQTAFVLMNHNYAKDLLYLKALKDSQPCYIGLLGPLKRKEQILSAFIEYHLEVEDKFLDAIYGPAGLDIGGETPEEIAISILSEIITVSRNKKAYHLQDKKGSIHNRSWKQINSANAK
ncbi:XdhC family protein [Bacteroidota bacterium]